jgi:hypothetical protein
MTSDDIRKIHARFLHSNSPTTANAAGIPFETLQVFLSNRSNLTENELYRLAGVLDVQVPR